MTSRIGPLLAKSFRQQLRDRVSLALTVLTPPFFVLLYWLFFSAEAPPVALGVVSPSEPAPVHVQGVLDVLDATVDLHGFDDREALEAAVRSGAVDAGLVVPTDLLTDGPSVATLLGDSASPQYLRAASVVRSVMQSYAASLGRYPPVSLEQVAVGAGRMRSAFDRYVPGLLVFAIIMLVFSASLAVAREVESGTIVRLRLAGVPSWQLLAGLSGVQLLLGIASVLLTLGVAVALGFESAGGLGWVAGIAALGCLASVGLGLIVAAVSRTALRAFLVSSVVMFLLLLFSGVVFPQPRVPLFDVGSRTVELFDVLPTTQVRSAFTSLMVDGRSAGAIVYEALSLVSASLICLGVGAGLFRKAERA